MRLSPPKGRGGRAGNTAHGEAQRRALVRVAFLLIAEKGFEGLRTRDVAERAGVNIATLHYYFATKEDLIRGVVGLMKELFSGIHPQGEELTDQHPLESLREDLTDVPKQWQTEPELFIVLIELYQRALRDPTIGNILGEMEEGWTEYLTSYVSRGVQQGVFRQDMAIPTLVILLRTFVKGLLLEFMTHATTYPTDQIFHEIERLLTTNARPIS